MTRLISGGNLGAKQPSNGSDPDAEIPLLCLNLLTTLLTRFSNNPHVTPSSKSLVKVSLALLSRFFACLP